MSFLLISLIHYLYNFFSPRAVLSKTNNKNANNDILEIINTIGNADKVPLSVEDTVIVEDTPINMENELDDFLKNLA
jgi:hypothetical protein